MEVRPVMDRRINILCLLSLAMEVCGLWKSYCTVSNTLNDLLPGRVTTTDASTFASVTRLQYDRLTKWASGEFTVGEPLPVYKKFEEIPLAMQPEYLTKASLEPTIGAGIYPGIEMGWNAELAENYETDEPYTAADKLLPGDLSKALSLPWQSDFVSALAPSCLNSISALLIPSTIHFLCSTCAGRTGKSSFLSFPWQPDSSCSGSRWPSTRPDAIVTKHDYKDWVKKFSEKLNAGIPPPEPVKRVPWERGLRVNYTGISLFKHF